MREPTLKPNVVFPHPDIVQGAMALRRPDLVASFRRSDVRRALKRSRWVSRTHWANNSVSPFLELFDADPDRLAAMVRRWDSSIAVVDTKTNINSVILWRDGDREKQVATPFSLSGWLRFITAGDALVDGVVVPRLNDVKAGLYLGLSYDRSAGFATDREVMAVRMPVLLLLSILMSLCRSRLALSSCSRCIPPCCTATFRIRVCMRLCVVMWLSRSRNCVSLSEGCLMTFRCGWCSHVSPMLTGRLWWSWWLPVLIL